MKSTGPTFCPSLPNGPNVQIACRQLPGKLWKHSEMCAVFSILVWYVYKLLMRGVTESHSTEIEEGIVKTIELRRGL
jgi:hypothetical protein